MLYDVKGHMEGQSQRYLTSGGSIHQKRLHSFSTEVHREREEASLSLNYRGDEAEEDNIDLELKLWVGCSSGDQLLSILVGSLLN